jgi:Cdc6-like AAA superfamily ATPase
VPHNEDRKLLELIEERSINHKPFRELLLVSNLSNSEFLSEDIDKMVFSEVIKSSRHPFNPSSHFDLTTNHLSKHLLVVGQSGSGKTTLLRNLMGEMEKPFWAFDLKQDYRHLSRDVLVLPWNELKFNPLRPPEGVSPMRWAQVFSEVFCHATALLSGSKNYVLKQVVRLYKLYNLFDGSWR